jgi:hypothetical protein
MIKLKQGQEVTFDLNEKVRGLTGKICGVIGPIIIVELKETLKGYNYTHIYILESQIQK